MVSGCSHLSGQSDLSEDGGRHEGGKNREKSGGKRIIAGVGRNTKVAIAVIARPTGTRGWVNGCSDVLPANRLSPSIRLPTLFLLHLSSFASTSIFAGGIWRRSSFPLRPRPSAKLPPILCTRNSPRFSFRTVKNREDYKFFLEDNIKAAIIIYIKLKGRPINIIIRVEEPKFDKERRFISKVTNGLNASRLHRSQGKNKRRRRNIVSPT